MFASEWDLIYDEENHDANASNRIPWFHKLIEGIDCRKHLFFILEAENTNTNKKEVLGFFTDMNTFDSKTQTMPTYSINMLHSKGNFLFKYNDDEELHFVMKN